MQVYSVTPDQMFVGMPFSLGSDRPKPVRYLKHMALTGPLVHDEDSMGKVTLRGLVYFMGEGDRKRLLAGIRDTCRVFFAAGATEVYRGIVGSKPIQNAGDVDDSVPDSIPARDLYLFAGHPMSTCPMGSDPETPTVDPDGRLYGWDYLYFADASVFPTSLGVNP